MNENYVVIPNHLGYFTTDQGDYIFKQLPNGNFTPVEFWTDARGRRKVLLPNADGHMQPYLVSRLIASAKYRRPLQPGLVVCHAHDEHAVETFDSLREDTQRNNIAERLRLAKPTIPKRSHEQNLTILEMRKLQKLTYKEIAMNIDIDQRVIEDCFGRRRPIFMKKCNKALIALCDTFSEEKVATLSSLVAGLARETKMERRKRLRANREFRRVMNELINNTDIPAYQAVLVETNQ